MKVELVDVSELRPHPKNPRVHPDSALDKLVRSIQEFGWTNPILVSKDGYILAGHARLKAAEKAGIKKVPVIYLSLEGEKAEAYMIADNKLQDETDWDYVKLTELLNELEDKGYEVENTGFGKEEIEQLNLWLMDTEQAVAENPITEEEIEGLKKAYKKIPWEKFRVFHACVGDQLYCVDYMNYLVSYGALDGKPPQAEKLSHCMLFVDSGLLAGARKEGKAFLDKQDEVIEFALKMDADWVAMMDVPMIDAVLNPLGIDQKTAYRYHLRNAEKFAEVKIPIRKVFVVQGAGLSDFKKCCEDMKGLVSPGDVVAIGSIKDRAADVEYISLVTSLVKEYFPQNDIHLFGVSTPKTVAYARLYGASSCDSATASMISALGSIAVFKKKDDGYQVEKISFEEIVGEHVSVGGKLWRMASAYNMAMVEGAILAVGQKIEMAAFGLSAAMEEAAISLEAERMENL